VTPESLKVEARSDGPRLFSAIAVTKVAGMPGALPPICYELLSILIFCILLPKKLFANIPAFTNAINPTGQILISAFIALIVILQNQ